MKNQRSYLLGGRSSPLALFENGILLYSNESKLGRRKILDIVYYRPLDCYFLNIENYFYRKDIDDQDPYAPKNKFYCGFDPSFQASTINQRIILNTNWQCVSAINPRTMKRDLRFRSPGMQSITAFTLFGNMDQFLAYVTSSGMIYLFCINYQYRKVLSKIKFRLRIENFPKHSCFFSLAVCPKGEYLCVEARHEGFHPRLIVLKVDPRSITFQAIVIKDEGWKDSLQCYGYLSRYKILFFGIEESQGEGIVEIFLFDKKTSELKMCQTKDTSTYSMESPIEVVNVGADFYLIGSDQRLMSLRLSSESVIESV